MTRPRDDRDRSTTLWAVLLIGLGIVVLAGNLGWFRGLATWTWAALFAAGGTGFLMYYARDRRQWWALIPGATLFGLAAAVLGGSSGGGLFLAAIGAGFAGVYGLERTRWWAIIPAGTLLTLGAVAWLDAVAPRFDAGWVFFLGLAATFGSLYALPEGEGRQRWAIYPALALLALAVVIMVSGAVTGIVAPLLLVAAGVYLLWRRGGPAGRASPPARKGA